MVNVSGIVRALMEHPDICTVVDAPAVDADLSVTEAVVAPLIAATITQRASSGAPPVGLVVVPTSRRAESIRGALEALADIDVVEFPAWETLPHERLSPSAQVVGERLAALRALVSWDGERPLLIVASVRAAVQPFAAGLGDTEPLVLARDDSDVALEDVSRRLIELAYTRVDMVTRRGEFAVRGGILDVFAPADEHAARVEFFGDVIDDIRWFAVADQRSLPGVVPQVVLEPARELLLTPAVRQRARERMPELPGVAEMLEKMADGIPSDGMESLTAVVAEGMSSIAEELPRGAAVFVVDPERCVSRSATLAETNQEFLEAAWSAATAGASAPISLDAGGFLTVEDVRERAAERGASCWSLSPFDSGASELRDSLGGASAEGAERLPGEPVPRFAGKVDGALDYVKGLVADGWRVVVTAAGAGTLERARDVLHDADIAATVVDALDEVPPSGVVTLTQAELESGFVVAESSLAVLTESEFYGRATTTRQVGPKKLAARRKQVVDPLQLRAGDYVVHATHGIGRFVEMTQRTVHTGTQRTGPIRARSAQTSVRDYLVLEYAPSKRGHPGDKLFVPTDQLDLLSRYVGGEAPALSKMGGSDWAQAKGRARKAVRDIAVELVKLYSARMQAKGFAFSPDTPWQRELEDAFPFVETADQVQVIDEIKADMEKPVPMDRLLSGDVGFGKTEVAVRAAFKAIQDGKQAAMLVPTTLLVKQHLETFRDRFAGFPLQVRPLSRFQTDAETKKTLDGLADGSIDMVIGTHRVLSDGVAFKDLGLVIVDEEQRFGVEHKDALKKLRTNVDILSMSATPIPRTLEMAVTGIREMSTLATPPEDRHPILSFVGPANDRQLAAAIRRELLREGQVFFVHNRVSSIQRTAQHIMDLVPEARVAVAHGQMGETQLEQVVDDFWERKFDVLVCTTIIETGIDIANANTIIIDRADRYGLAQLHQLRGRVGRGRERAYAYFVYDPDTPLSETAADRLETIAVNNDLGSGIQVAMKDLELRGAGNLLGAEQAGHIAGVGFDLYLRMIGEAVASFRGDDAAGPTELRLELPVEARLPDDYIDSERLRLEAYQKLSAAAAANADADAIARVVDELTDRYGALPSEAQGLVAVARLRRQAALAGLSDVVAMGKNLRIAPARLPDSLQVRLARLYPGAKFVSGGEAVLVPFPADPAGGVLEWVSSLITAIFPSATAAGTEHEDASPGTSPGGADTRQEAAS